MRGVSIVWGCEVIMKENYGKSGKMLTTRQQTVLLECLRLKTCPNGQVGSNHNLRILESKTKALNKVLVGTLINCDVFLFIS